MFVVSWIELRLSIGNVLDASLASMVAGSWKSKGSFVLVIEVGAMGVARDIVDCIGVSGMLVAFDGGTEDSDIVVISLEGLRSID